MTEQALQEIPATNDMQVGTADMLFAPGMMQALEHFAMQMAKGKSTIPAHLQGSPADCMAVTMQAAQWKMNPFAVAQKTHLVNGTLGYEAQLVNAVVSSSRAIRGRFRYEWDGEGATIACRVGATLAGETDLTWGPWVRKSDQSVQNSPLWKTDPAQQLAYLAVKKWARLYTPDVILGVYTPDELETIERDMGQAQVVQDAPTETRTQSLKDKVKARQAPAQPAEQSESVDTDTGEVIAQAPDWTKSKASMLAHIAAAESVDDLDQIADIARDIQMGAATRKTITSALAERSAALEGG